MSDDGIQSIARAAAVLRALGRHRRGLSLGEIAAESGLPRSTVQRLVAALQHERFVESGGPSGPGVRLGPALGELAGAIHLDIVRLARPYLQALFASVRETVDIARAEGGEVRFLDQIVSDRELRVVPRKDAPQPLHCMANGKALLSLMPDDAVARLVGPAPARPTSASIGSLAALLAELAEVRRTGFAYDREEHSEGVCAVGVPVGVDLAISVAVPQYRFDVGLPAIRAALVDCRSGVEAALAAIMNASAVRRMDVDPPVPTSGHVGR